MYWLLDTFTLLVIISTSIFLGLCSLVGFDQMQPYLFGHDHVMAVITGLAGAWQLTRQRISFPKAE